MSPRIDPTVLKQQVDALLKTLAEIKVEGDEMALGEVPAFAMAPPVPALGMAAAQAAAPAPSASLAVTAQAAAAAAADAGAIDRLVGLASSPQNLRAAQAIAAQRLLAFDSEVFPHDGCAITLSVLMQQAGIEVSDTFPAIALGQALQRRGWKKITVGQQQKGDVGSTCGTVAHHGTDHIYLVLRDVNDDEMVIADNQETSPHFRFASGNGKSPTTFFLRAAGA